MEGETDVVLVCVGGVLVLLGQLGNMENRLSNNSLNPDRLLQASHFSFTLMSLYYKTLFLVHNLHTLSLYLLAQA